MNKRFEQHFFLNVVGLVLMVSVIPFAYWGRESNWDIIFAAATCLALGNVEKFEFFSLGLKGLETKTRKTIEEARATVKEVQSLALNIIEFIVWWMEAGDRLGGASTQEKEIYFHNMINTLKRLRIDDNSINKIEEIRHPYINFDYYCWVKSGTIRGKSPENNRLWNNFEKDNSFKGIGSEPSLNKIREFLEQHNLMDEDTKERLNDYEYFTLNNKHRRPKIWQARYDH